MWYHSMYRSTLVIEYRILTLVKMRRRHALLVPLKRLNGWLGRSGPSVPVSDKAIENLSIPMPPYSLKTA